MAELFPFFGDIQAKSQKELPLYQEVAWDYENNIPLLEDGKFKIVSGNEAIQTWCYKALQVRRYKLPVYSWNYGSELESLIGSFYSKALSQAECVRFVEECLMVNPYILGVSNIQSIFEDGKLKVTCDLNTVYGETALEEVNIHV